MSRPLLVRSGKLPNEPHCPACGRQLDGFTTITDPMSRPKPGDKTRCIYCKSTLAFTGDAFTKEVGLRLATPTEQMQFDAEIRRIGEAHG